MHLPVLVDRVDAIVWAHLIQDDEVAALGHIVRERARCTGRSRSTHGMYKYLVEPRRVVEPRDAFEKPDLVGQ